MSSFTGAKTVEVDGGITSHQNPLGAGGVHNDFLSVDNTDVGVANGPFTTTAGDVVATADLKYGDSDTSKVHQMFSDLTSSSNGQGGTNTYSDSFDWTDKATHGDSGERDETSIATTDDGTTTNTDHGTGTYSNLTTITFPGGFSSIGITNGDTRTFSEATITTLGEPAGPIRISSTTKIGPLAASPPSSSTPRRTIRARTSTRRRSSPTTRMSPTTARITKPTAT